MEFNSVLAKKLENRNEVQLKIFAIRAILTKDEIEIIDSIKKDYAEITNNFIKVSDLIFTPSFKNKDSRPPVLPNLDESLDFINDDFCEEDNKRLSNTQKIFFVILFFIICGIIGLNFYKSKRNELGRVINLRII